MSSSTQPADEVRLRLLRQLYASRGPPRADQLASLCDACAFQGVSMDSLSLSSLSALPIALELAVPSAIGS
jgi:hypothetical protein